MNKIFIAFLLILSVFTFPKNADAAPTAEEVVSMVELAFSSIEGYSCIADAHYKKGLATEDKVYKIFFKKPEKIRIDVQKGDPGAVAVLAENGKVRGHKGGFLSWIVLEYDLDNSMVTTIRGHTLKQSHFGYFIKMLKGSLTNEAVSVEMKDCNGSDTYILESEKGPHRGVVYIDADTKFFKRILEYEDGVEVVNVEYSDIVVENNLSDALFKI